MYFSALWRQTLYMQGPSPLLEVDSKLTAYLGCNYSGAHCDFAAFSILKHNTFFHFLRTLWYFKFASYNYQLKMI